MNKKFAVLALSVAMVSVLGGRAFADNTQGQSSFGSFSPNSSLGSNNDLFSDNVTGSYNIQPAFSFNDLSTNDSGNFDGKIKDSFNDSSKKTIDSHDDNSVNQAAVGQVNLNYSDAGNINAADNQSTIFDGDVKIGGGGYGGGYGDFGYGGYGGGGSGDNNINTGAMSNSVLGNDSGLFSNVGVGANGSDIKDSTISTGSTLNQNLLNP